MIFTFRLLTKTGQPHKEKIMSGIIGGAGSKSGVVGRLDTVAFYACNGAGQNSAGVYIVDFGTVVVDTHGVGTATRFTAPITGKYICSYGWMTNSSSSNRSSLFKNNAAYGTSIYVAGHTYARMMNTVAVILNVNDYLEVKNNVSTGTEGDRHGGYDYFSVLKI